MTEEKLGTQVISDQLQAEQTQALSALDLAELRQKYGLPEGVIPKLEEVNPATEEEIEEIRSRAGLGGGVAIRGNGISGSGGGARGTRKLSAQYKGDSIYY